MSETADTKAINPAALTVEEAAKILGVPQETICEDIAQGVPTDADGRLNLVHYAAWLNQQIHPEKTDGD